MNVSSALREAVTVEETISTLMEETINALEAEAATILLLEDGALAVAGLSGPFETSLGQRRLLVASSEHRAAYAPELR